MTNRRRTLITGGFLAATAVAVGWELVASFDGSADTVPWTDLIVGHIPAEVTVAAVGALVLWLPVHFGIRYYRKARGRPIDGGPDDPPRVG